MKKKLKFNSLGELGGGALGLSMDLALGTLLADLHNRPALDKARSVTLKIEITPQIDKQSGSGVLSDADVDFKIETKVPGVTTSTTKCRLDKSGELVFDVDVPDASDGPTIMDEAERLRQEKLEVARAHLAQQEQEGQGAVQQPVRLAQ